MHISKEAEQRQRSASPHLQGLVGGPIACIRDRAVVQTVPGASRVVHVSCSAVFRQHRRNKQPIPNHELGVAVPGGLVAWEGVEHGASYRAAVLVGVEEGGVEVRHGSHAPAVRLARDLSNLRPPADEHHACDCLCKE